MAFNATHKFARISPRKVRPLADLVRGKYADEALDILKFQSQRGARMLEKVIRSALGNAEHQQAAGVDADLVKSGDNADGEHRIAHDRLHEGRERRVDAGALQDQSDRAAEDAMQQPEDQDGQRSDGDVGQPPRDRVADAFG